MAYSKKFKIYLADTDATGFVYYARYLEWMEAARIDLLNQTGTTLSDLISQGISAVVRNVSCSYEAPIQLGEEVEVLTSVSKLGKTNVIIFYEFINITTGKKAGTGEVSIVFIDQAAHRPARIPENIFTGFSKYLIQQEAAAV